MVLHPCGDYGGSGGFVDCYAQNVGGGGGHNFYESVKNGLESFRLRDDFSAAAAATADMLLNDDTSSIASKKRIDSLFKATASVAGDESKKQTSGHNGTAAGRLTKSLTADDDRYHRGSDYFDYGYAADNNNNNKNTVQEKIEKMFAEISSSELDTDVSMESAAAVGCNKYHVRYIGCASLSGKISSLEGLQQPVRDMYFGYRENQHNQHYRGESGAAGDGRVNKAHDFAGLLEISAIGLTIRYRDETGDTVHRIDPFPSIAVWAALKYVCRRRTPPPSPQHRRSNIAYTTAAGGYEYAFLPLIADPDGSDKAALFRDVDAADRARLDAAGDHVPVFAVVMRKAGKRLECHGFACETENDALMMAANLYGALVAAMSSAAAADAVQTGANNNKDNVNERRSTSPAMPRRVIRQRNGFTSMSSTAGSSVGGGDVAPVLPPPRPPRRNKKATSSTTSSVGHGGGDGDRTSVIGADDVDDVCSDSKTFRMIIGGPPSLQRGVCKSSSLSAAAASDVLESSVHRIDENKPIKKHSNNGGGDILTKVAIPRSKSFLNSNGLASTKYSRRAAGCGIETAAVDRRRRRSNGSSVMGFSDMFNELRLQEGLNNMDEILNAIINVEGMSFNDLKPIYREFLIKLAMTLTKDELYQRTKVIMTEQKRKRNNKRSTASAVSSKSAGRGRRLNEKLRDALNLRAAKSRIGAVLLPGFCKRNKLNNAKASHHKQRRCSCSADGSDVQLAERKPADSRKNQRRTGKKPVAPSLKGHRRRHINLSPVCSTSDDSEFFAVAALRQRQHQVQQQQQMQQQKQIYRKSRSRVSKRTGSSGCSRGTIATTSEGGCIHRTSSGYFSCSECSAGAADEKCYCGAGAVGETEPMSLMSCSCDSDSCADSDKCYCGRPRRPRNIFDELKSRGFAASESSVSRADSPGTAWKKNEKLLLQQRGHEPSYSGGPGGGSSSATTGIGGIGVSGGIESSKSIEYLQVMRRPLPVDQQHYSSVTKPAVDRSRMKVYGDGGPADSTTTAAGSSSSPSSSLSAATVYSSSSAVGGGGHHSHRRPPGRRRSGSSGSDNFQAIDYALFANNSGVAAIAAAKKYYRAAGCMPSDGRRRTNAEVAAFSMNRSYSSEAVHNMTGYRVYHHRPHNQTDKANAARRHSVHDGGDDVLASFFRSDIENSLGYYP